MMTAKEANAKAIQEFGPDFGASLQRRWRRPFAPIVYRKLSPFVADVAYGSTWDEAFANMRTKLQEENK